MSRINPKLSTPSFIGVLTDKTFSFSSTVGAKTDYYGGFYLFGSSNNDFSPSITFGDVNGAYGAHFFVVTGAVAADDITITVSGTSIMDDGTVTSSDSTTISIPSGSTANSYFETSKKWIGQLTIETTAGTAINCNYGFCKYWDNNNTDFYIKGVDATFVGGANDSTADILIYHHKSTGWTYNAGDEPTPPTALYSMRGEYGSLSDTVDGEGGAWKLTNLTNFVEGSGSEGIILGVVSGAQKAFLTGNCIVTIAV